MRVTTLEIELQPRSQGCNSGCNSAPAASKGVTTSRRSYNPDFEVVTRKAKINRYPTMSYFYELQRYNQLQPSILTREKKREIYTRMHAHACARSRV